MKTENTKNWPVYAFFNARGSILECGKLRSDSEACSYRDGYSDCAYMCKSIRSKWHIYVAHEDKWVRFDE